MSKIKSLHITEQNMPHRHANNRLIDLGWYFKANNGPFGCVYKGLNNIISKVVALSNSRDSMGLLACSLPLLPSFIYH